jgi:hypothetical protein
MVPSFHAMAYKTLYATNVQMEHIQMWRVLHYNVNAVPGVLQDKLKYRLVEIQMILYAMVSQDDGHRPIITFRGPLSNEIIGPSQMKPTSNSPAPILNIFYSWYIYFGKKNMFENILAGPPSLRGP